MSQPTWTVSATVLKNAFTLLQNRLPLSLIKQEQKDYCLVISAANTIHWKNLSRRPKKFSLLLSLLWKESVIRFKQPLIKQRKLCAPCRFTMLPFIPDHCCHS